MSLLTKWKNLFFKLVFKSKTNLKFRSIQDKANLLDKYTSIKQSKLDPKNSMYKNNKMKED